MKELPNPTFALSPVSMPRGSLIKAVKRSMQPLSTLFQRFQRAK